MYICAHTRHSNSCFNKVTYNLQSNSLEATTLELTKRHWEPSPGASLCV